MSNRAHDVLYESEATLRLVDHDLDELRDGGHPEEAFVAVSMTEFPEILARANERIMSVLAKLRDTRAALRSPIDQTERSGHD